MNNVRQLVISALISVELQSGYSNLTLDNLLKKEALSSQDKAFVSRLFYGVIERLITLDYYISKLSSKPVKKLSPLVKNCIRIGIYQLEYMDKIPTSAAVNESVKIIKNSKESYASGFVNAILRSFIRNKPKLPEDSSEFAKSVSYSCPGWFIEELTAYLGAESADEFLKNSLTPPPMFLRVNNTVTTVTKVINCLKTIGIISEQTDVENCIKVNSLLGIENTAAFKNGWFHIQDISSQLCITALAPQSGDRVLDICAAPGGKTCTAAELMENKGEIVSCDLYSHRVKLIENNSQRLNLSIVNATVNDALKINKTWGKFNRIICDVPCSGFGVIRRKPEIKYKSPYDLTNLADLQYNILEISSGYLEQGGTIVYSTCTLRRCENEDVVLKFLNNHPDFYLDNPFPKFDCGCGSRLTNSNCGGDGFFFAVLKRK